MSFKFLNKTATKFFRLEIFSFFSRGRVAQSLERPSKGPLSLVQLN